MLSEELFRVKQQRSPALDGEAEDNDVHVWKASLGAFSVDTPLVRRALADAAWALISVAAASGRGPARSGCALPRLRR
jgi:hypothetical protein